MQVDNIKILEMLSLIYEDLDIDTVESRFIELTDKVFSFDRLALFFVKHRKAILQGKLNKGFDQGVIESLQVPVSEEHILTRPLINGFPIWGEEVDTDPVIKNLNLDTFAIIPVVNKKRVPCWQMTDCHQKECPAFGNKWLRCWLAGNTRCNTSHNAGIENERDCKTCPVYIDQKNVEYVEGILLVDNSISKQPITNEIIMTLSLIGHTVGSAIDNAKRFERTLRVSIKDDLTDLHNRRYFNERLLDELERVKRYPDEPVSLLLVDIDHFKRINDSHGHQVGDDVLVWFARLLQKKLRKSDIVARYGGEEFAILLINTDKTEAEDVAEELRREIERSSSIGTGGIEVTSSFGVATFLEDARSLKSLISKADKALYTAKAQGRNRVVVA